MSGENGENNVILNKTKVHIHNALHYVYYIGNMKKHIIILIANSSSSDIDIFE